MMSQHTHTHTQREIHRHDDVMSVCNGGDRCLTNTCKSWTLYANVCAFDDHHLTLGVGARSCMFVLVVAGSECGQRSFESAIATNQRRLRNSQNCSEMEAAKEEKRDCAASFTSAVGLRLLFECVCVSKHDQNNNLLMSTVVNERIVAQQTTINSNSKNER